MNRPDPMRGWVGAFPAMLEQAARSPAPVGWAIEGNRTVLAAGMGGSGMAGLLAGIHLQQKGARVFAWHDPELPAWVGSDDALLLISYSGETWEATALFDQAIARSVPIRVVASGGRLAALAESHCIPLFHVPGGMAPRAALPWLLVGALRALPGWNQEETDEAAERIRAEAASPRAGRDALAIAAELSSDLIPWILPVGIAMEAVALRWRNQLLENAEVPCIVSPIPEMAHNEIMAWPRMRVLGLNPAFMALQGAEVEDSRLGLLLDALESEAIAQGFPFMRIPPPAGLGLAGVLAQVYLGDRLSVELAHRLGVAASPVDSIQRLRSRCRKETER